MLKLALQLETLSQVKLSLVNDGQEPLLVNGRLAINAPYSPEPFREIGFVITDQDGAEADFLARINIGFPQDANFITLEPGQAVDREVDLTAYYQLEPGRYTVVATYENQTDPSDGQAWKGTVSSQTTITL
jgi:hypothetical protein